MGVSSVGYHTNCMRGGLYTFHLQTWKDSNGRPKIGLRRRDGVPFGDTDSSPDAQQSARWMREKLDLLVSDLYPR